MSEFTLNIIQLDQNGNILDNSDQSINWKDYGLYRLEPSIVFDEDVASIQISGEIGAFDVTEIIEVDVDNECIGEGLPAPTLFAFNTPTETTLDYSYTSNSGGEESGFEVQLSLLSDFSVIEQTDNNATGVTTGQFAGLSNGVYYGRVRAVGAIPSDWSNVDTAIIIDASAFYTSWTARGNTDDILIFGINPAVSSVLDQSGNNYDVSQGTATDQPAYDDGTGSNAIGNSKASYHGGAIAGDKLEFGGAKSVFNFLHQDSQDYTVYIVLDSNLSSGEVEKIFRTNNDANTGTGVRFLLDRRVGLERFEASIRNGGSQRAFVHSGSVEVDFSGLNVVCFRWDSGATQFKVKVKSANGDNVETTGAASGGVYAAGDSTDDLTVASVDQNNIPFGDIFIKQSLDSDADSTNFNNILYDYYTS
jgi:hypothetical protein